MSEKLEIIWAHGFGSHPDIDPTSRALRRALGARANLDVPRLSRLQDGVLTVYPPSIQGLILNAALDARPDVVFGHSQGAWALGEAVSAQPGRRLGRTVLCVPPFTGPLQRLTDEFRAPTPDERKLVKDFGGAHLVKDATLPGQPRLTVIPEQYWEEVADPHFDALELSELVYGHTSDPGLVIAGKDERLKGPAHEAKLGQLLEDVPDLTAERVVTLEDAGHFLLGPECAAAIAQIALEGFAVGAMGGGRTRPL